MSLVVSRPIDVVPGMMGKNNGGWFGIDTRRCPACNAVTGRQRRQQSGGGAAQRTGSWLRGGAAGGAAPSSSSSSTGDIREPVMQTSDRVIGEGSDAPLREQWVGGQRTLRGHWRAACEQLRLRHRPRLLSTSTSAPAARLHTAPPHCPWTTAAGRCVC